ncbi:MAG: Flp family type IVb pilin [Sphingomonadaceae bacterium]
MRDPKPAPAWRRFASEADGATMMEYALIASLATVVIAIAALALLKN